MIQLVTCPACKGFLAFALRACPHCAAPIDRARHLLLGVAALAGGGAVSMTLMACYGSPCVEESNPCRYVPDDAGADAQDGSGGDAGDAGDAGDGGDASHAPDAESDASTDGGSDAEIDAAFDGSDAATEDASADATAHD